MNIWDIISLSLYALMFTPLFGLVYSWNIIYLYQLLGIGICSAFIKLTRLMPKNKITLRPPGAFNCNIYNRGGDCSKRVGMPSGHVLLTTFILLSFGYIQTNQILYFNTYLVLCLVWISLMALSRVKRNCHTILQVLVGGILGIILYFIWAKIITYIKKNDK